MTPFRSTAPPRPTLESLRVRLADGVSTTLRVARFERASWTARVAAFTPMRRLRDWCADTGVPHAMIGGFYVRADDIPLGDLRMDGMPIPSVPFDAPWDRVRACVHSLDGEVALRSRIELPADPRGDLMQAGPMLLRGGVSLVEPGVDPEGFSAGARQFDSDITDGRHPRAALGMGGGELIAAVCEGRSDHEAGLTLAEFARALRDLGAVDAINLDGGGSTSLVIDGELLNTPREEHGIEIVGGRVVPTALRFTPR